MTPRLIVPGASGFIGQNLTLAVPADWETIALYCTKSSFPTWVEREGLEHVTATRCDLTDEAEVHALAQRVGSHFDACVFLAANGDPAFDFLIDHIVDL